MAIQLNKREKLILWVTGVVVGLFLVGKIVLFPYLAAREKWAGQLAAKKVALVEIQALKAEYDHSKQLTARSKGDLKKRGKDFTLFSFLNSVSDKANIRDNIAYMKPSTTEKKDTAIKMAVVEMKLAGVTLEQLMTYLYMVETSGNQVFVKRSAISNSARKKGFLDATLLIETAI